jgi:hypothetical protein
VKEEEVEMKVEVEEETKAERSCVSYRASSPITAP